MTKTFIVWDLGATKCGAAKVTITDHHYICDQAIAVVHKDFKSLDDLVDHIEASLSFSHEKADRILIAGAGVYDGYVLENANPYPFRMDFARIAWERHWPSFKVSHDYVPVLCSTFTPYVHDPKHATAILSGVQEPHGRHVVFGVGTGLGLKDGALLPNHQLWVGSNEVGHVGITFPPAANVEERQRHQEFKIFLQRTLQEPISFEAILAGRGLALIHQFCTAAANPLLPAQISELLHTGKAEATVAMYAWYLGLFVGYVQLSFMPTGGIWMTGGVLKKNPMLAHHPELLKGIQAHPAYQQTRALFPLGFIMSDELAYLGGAWYIGLEFGA